MKRQVNNQAGFTLIEIMTVVVIIGILAAIAYPSYRDSVRKSHRSSAQAFMMEIAEREQQVFVDSRSYVAVNGNANCNTEKSNYETALGISPSIKEVCNFYSIAVTLTGGPPPGFLITATAKGDQAKDGNMTLNSQGVKTRGGNPGW